MGPKCLDNDRDGVLHLMVLEQCNEQYSTTHTNSEQDIYPLTITVDLPDRVQQCTLFGYVYRAVYHDDHDEVPNCNDHFWDKSPGEIPPLHTHLPGVTTTGETSAHHQSPIHVQCVRSHYAYISLHFLSTSRMITIEYALHTPHDNKNIHHIKHPPEEHHMHRTITNSSYEI